MSAETQTSKKNGTWVVLACPHCQKEMNALIKAKVSGETYTREEWEETFLNGAPAKKAAPSPNMPRHEQMYLKRAQENGIFDAFVSVVEKRAETGHSMPKNLDAYFMVVMKTLRPVTVPRRVLDALIRDGRTPNPNIVVSASNGIGVVTENGVITRFLLQDLYSGQKLRGEAGRPRTVLEANLDVAEEWIKTRFGYVPRGSRLFLDEMNRSSKGDFSNFRV